MRRTRSAQEYTEKGDESKLHVILFDEIDVLCRPRGRLADGGVGQPPHPPIPTPAPLSLH